MPRYAVTLRATLEGVECEVEAADEPAARELIEAAKWQRLDRSLAEIVDWEITKIEEGAP